MKIKLDNLSGDNVTVLVTGSWQEAKEDQSIAGSHWEHAGDDFGYAVVMDRPDLLEELEAEGYDVDSSEYCPPEMFDAEERHRGS